MVLQQKRGKITNSWKVQAKKFQYNEDETDVQKQQIQGHAKYQ